MRSALITCTLALTLAMPTVAQAAGPLDQISLGEHWYGPNHTLDDLKGRVVMFELWGYN